MEVPKRLIGQIKETDKFFEKDRKRGFSMNRDLEFRISNIELLY